MADFGGIQQNATQRMMSLGPLLPGSPTPGGAENVRTLYGLSPSTTYAANQVAVSPDIMQAAGFQLQQNSLGHSYWVPAGNSVGSTVMTLNAGGQTDNYQPNNTNPSLTPSPVQQAPATPNAPPFTPTVTGANLPIASTSLLPGGGGPPERTLGGGLPLPPPGHSSGGAPVAPGHLISSTLPTPAPRTQSGDRVQSKLDQTPIRRLVTVLATRPQRPAPVKFGQPGPVYGTLPKRFPVVNPGGPIRNYPL